MPDARCQHPKPDGIWHLDEVFLRSNGEQHYLWRAVDQNNVVLDILAQARRNAAATSSTSSGASFLTACAATASQTAISSPRSSTGRADTSTTGPKTRTGLGGEARGRCSGSNRPARHDASSHPMGLSMVTSIHHVICSYFLVIDLRGPRRSGTGRRRRAQSTE